MSERVPCGSRPPTKPNGLLRAAAARLFGLTALGDARAELCEGLGDAATADGFLRASVRWLDLRLDFPAPDLERVPAAGPLLVVANHPTGAMEGILLLTMLRSIRSDVRVLATDVLATLPELRELLLLVDVQAPAGANVVALRQALRWLRGGGCVLAFPAGEVAARRRPWHPVREAPWHPAIAGLQRRSGAVVLPTWISGRSPLWFQAAGALHPRLRTALLPRLLLSQRQASVALRIGNPVPSAQSARFVTDRERIDHLRLRCEILQRRVVPPVSKRRVLECQPAVASSVPRERLEADVDALPRSAELLRSGCLRVLVAPARRLPNVLPEIGRLRELTFRGVGEGSGKSADLDRFDADYQHLFVWDESRRTIVGAYRIGVVSELLDRFGPRSLYTATMYRYATPFLQHVYNGLELGRSFVQPEYQKAYLPLFLLWRGIGALVARDPRHRLLFGTVSISADHHATSVSLMVDHLRSHCFDAGLGAHVESLQPWRRPRLERSQSLWQRQQIADLHDVSTLVRELEVGRQGVPVLLEQYLKLGAKVVGINVDPAFHSIDALVVVDLLRAPAALQARYLGPEGAQALRARHGVAGAIDPPAPPTIGRDDPAAASPR